MQWHHARRLESVILNWKPDSVKIGAFYFKDIPAKFHPNPIWNDGALGFLDQIEERSA